MKVSDAIKRADALRMNTITEEQKAAWVCELDGQLAELMDVPPQENIWPKEQTLLMPAPYEDIYVLYLIGKIDLYNQEGVLYANDMTLYNAALAEAMAWWRRKHRPAPCGNWRVM